MSCPNCDHTMHRLGCQITECLGSFWCPRCGTLNTEGTVSVPALVDRVRRYRDLENEGRGLLPFSLQLWHRLGIWEAIALPANRPQGGA